MINFKVERAFRDFLFTNDEVPTGVRFYAGLSRGSDGAEDGSSNQVGHDVKKAPYCVIACLDWSPPDEAELAGFYDCSVDVGIVSNANRSTAPEHETLCTTIRNLLLQGFQIVEGAAAAKVTELNISQVSDRGGRHEEDGMFWLTTLSITCHANEFDSALSSGIGVDWVIGSTFTIT